jgi:hypothetical protein
LKVASPVLPSPSGASPGADKVTIASHPSKSPSSQRRYSSRRTRAREYASGVTPWPRSSSSTSRGERRMRWRDSTVAKLRTASHAMMVITLFQASLNALGSGTSRTLAPASRSVATASPKFACWDSVAIGHLGVFTTASRGAFASGASGTARVWVGPRMPVASSRASWPMRQAPNQAASATLRAKTPTVSRVALNGWIPVREIAP